MSRRPGSSTDKLWRRFYRWRMDNGFENCRFCGVKDNLTFDHIIPWIKGGTLEIENTSILCYECNQEKGSKIMSIEPCVWPPMDTEMKNFADLEIGDRTMHGVVEEIIDMGLMINSNGYENHIFKIRFSGYCPMSEISQKLRDDKKFNETGFLSRPAYCMMHMYPGE